MKVLYQLCRSGDRHQNEDIVGQNAPYYWVIDGATEVFNNHTISEDGDVFWTVQTLNKKLERGDSDLPIRVFLAHAVEQLKNDALTRNPSLLTYPINRLPTYAICCVRCEETAIEYLCLGDCSLFVSTNPSIRITDTRILPFHLKINAVKEKFKNNPVRYAAEVKKASREIKNSINIENGYWIGSFEPSVISKGVYGRIPVKSGDRVLVCSDGFRPSLDESKLVGFKEKDIFDEERLNTILNTQALREKEYEAQTGICISDDTSVLLIEI